MRVRLISSVLFLLFFGVGCHEGTEGLTEIDFSDFESWTKNPSLETDVGLWWVRTFCWAIIGDCPDDLLLSEAEWIEDGSVFLKAKDDNTLDLGCDCAAMTQGIGFDGSVRGDPLTRIRTGDLEAAYILLKRSDSGSRPCPGIVGSGNIINLWLKHPDGSIWVTDFYFETVGLNEGFSERAGPHNLFIRIFQEGGADWYAYQMELTKYPEYWTKTTYPDGSEYWIIDLKSLLDRGSAYSGRDLSDYRWYYVDVVCENVCLGLTIGESASWQNVHYFDIKVKFRE